MDYCFLTKDGSDAFLTVLVIKGRESRAILARPVLRKGRLRDDSGPGCGEHSTAQAPPAGPAQDRQRARAGRPAPGSRRAAG
eukprot:11296329-Alexandrium_andersonii.AAC.1